MARISVPEPSGNRAVPVQPGQALRLEAADYVSPPDWFQRTNGGSWSQIGTGVAELFWSTPTSVTNRDTFDEVEVALGSGGVPDTGTTRHFNLCEGPVSTPFVTTAARNEAAEEPPLRGFDGEDDDPPHGVPLAMLGANRDRLATVPLETVSEPGGPANLIASYGPGLFVDTAGKLGCRTAFTNDVRGLGPFPAIASYHHAGLHVDDAFGASRTLGLTRVLFEDAAGNVAVVRGDGRRNTYRWTGSAYESAAGLQNVLTQVGADFEEETPSGRVYLYSSAGQLQRVVDRYGNTAYYRYDANARLQKIEGPTSAALGLVPYLSYDANGRLARLVLEDPSDAANNRTSYFEYDASGNLTKLIGPELCVTYFAYTGAGLIESVSDPEGFTWRAGYDGSGRVDRLADAVAPPDTGHVYFAYDPAAALSTVRDRAGKATYFRYTPWGSPDRVFNVGTPADYFQFSGDGDLVAAKNRLGREWSYEYDPRGNRIAVNDPLAARTYFAYDGQDLLRELTDPLGRTTRLEYDAARNRTRWIDPIGNTVYYEYQASGLLHFRKDRRGALTYFAFDGRGLPEAVVDPLRHTTYFVHNAAGERSEQKDPLGRITRFEHDKRGRVIKQVDPIGAATYLVFDGRCNLVSQTDARLNQTSHEYDANSNRTRTVDALGNATYFAYDAEERLVEQKDARLNATTWTYDVLGRRQKQVDALGFETYFAHDDAHQLERQVDARGHATTFEYDLAGRLSHQTNANLDRAYFGYDLAGQRVVTLDLREKPTTFEYDPRGWLRKTTTAVGAETYLVYDAEGNRTRSVDPRGKAAYFTYDLAGRLTHAEDQLGGVTYTGYDAASQTVLRLDELGSPTYFSHDAAGRSQRTRDGAGLVTYHAYDLVGNLVMTNLDQGWGCQPWGSSPYGGQRATTYHAYDAINRRVTTTDAYGAVSTTEYDRVSNVERSVNPRGLATYHTYDALDRRTHTKDNVHFAPTYMGFDEVGNVVLQSDAQGVSTYLTYDALNRQKFVHDPAGALTYFSYDEASNRTQTRVLMGAGGEERVTSAHFDDLNRTVRQIAADSGETYFEYDLAGNQVMAVDPEGRPTYFVFDDLNRQELRRNAFGHTWQTVFDARSSVTRQIDPEGRTAYFGYDDARRLLHQSNAFGEYSYFSYDARGLRTRVQNPRGYSTYFRHDLLGRQTHRIDALGGVSYMGYDQVGNQVLALDEKDNPTYFFFDGLNRSTHVKDALGGVTYMGYDSRFSAVLRVDADGRATYMAYDPARRLERQWFANPVAGESADSPIYFSYDQVGNLLTSDDSLAGLGTTVQEFDKLDRLTKKVTVAGAVYYEFDRSGKKVAFKDADLSKNYYVYDAAGRLTREWLDDARTAYFDYDDAGLRTKRILPSNRVIAYYTFDNAGRVQQLDNYAPGFGSIAYFAYQRNALGAPTWVRHENGENTYYEYDALDRLTLEERKDSSSTMYGFRYAYDQCGNRTNKSTFSSPASEVYYEHDARNLVSKEHVLSGDTSYYAYDLAQRMTSLKVTGSGQSAYFSHDQRGQATQIDFAKASSPDATRTFAYNGGGERVYVNDGEATYWQHDGDKLVLERLADGTAKRRYRRNKSASNCASDMVEIVLPSGIRVYQATDPNGTPRTAVDHLEGVPQGTYLVDAFGNTLIDENDLAGLAEVRARWQGSVLARVNTTNMGLVLPGDGLCYLPGLPGLTSFGTGLLGTVSIATNGPWNDWICGMVPPPEDKCEAGRPRFFFQERARVEALDSRTKNKAFSRCIQIWKDGASAELDSTKRVQVPTVTGPWVYNLADTPLPGAYQSAGLFYFVEIPFNDPTGTSCAAQFDEYALNARMVTPGSGYENFQDTIGDIGEIHKDGTTSVAGSAVQKHYRGGHLTSLKRLGKTQVAVRDERTIGWRFKSVYVFCDIPQFAGVHVDGPAPVPGVQPVYFGDIRYRKHLDQNFRVFDTGDKSVKAHLHLNLWFVAGFGASLSVDAFDITAEDLGPAPELPPWRVDRR